MSNRPNVHYHRHRSGPGVGGSIVLSAFNFALQMLIMGAQLTMWLVPQVFAALAWFVRNILIPAVRALA